MFCVSISLQQSTYSASVLLRIHKTDCSSNIAVIFVSISAHVVYPDRVPLRKENNSHLFLEAFDGLLRSLLIQHSFFTHAKCMPPFTFTTWPVM